MLATNAYYLAVNSEAIALSMKTNKVIFPNKTELSVNEVLKRMLTTTDFEFLQKHRGVLYNIDSET
jgi:hypothetical protein